MTWIVLARTEDEDSMFEPEDRLQAEDYEAMVASYDPEFRRAPVVSGFSKEAGVAGPAHWVGEDLEPLGYVEKLDFDGMNLWGKVAELKGRVSEYVANGFWQRSIGFWRHLSEVKGKPYLRHLALLGGEQPGIPNMPPLTEYFSEQVGSPEMGRVVANAQYEVRGIFNPEKEQEMDRKELRSEITSLLSDSMSTLKDDIKEAIGGLSDSFNEGIGSVRDSVQRIDGEIEALRADSEVNRNDAKEVLIDSGLERLVSKGRMTPAERESEKKFLLKMSEEDIKERLEDLNQRSPILSDRLTGTQIADDGSVDADNVDVSQYVSEMGGPVNQKSLSILKEATARGNGDFAAMRRAAYALHGEVAGGTN